MGEEANGILNMWIFNPLLYTCIDMSLYVVIRNYKLNENTKFVEESFKVLHV